MDEFVHEICFCLGIFKWIWCGNSEIVLRDSDETTYSINNGIIIIIVIIQLYLTHKVTCVKCKCIICYSGLEIRRESENRFSQWFSKHPDMRINFSIEMCNYWNFKINFDSRKPKRNSTPVIFLHITLAESSKSSCVILVSSWGNQN